jgi:hypothetical protein
MHHREGTDVVSMTDRQTRSIGTGAASIGERQWRGFSASRRCSRASCNRYPRCPSLLARSTCTISASRVGLHQANASSTTYIPLLIPRLTRRLSRLLHLWTDLPRPRQAASRSPCRASRRIRRVWYFWVRKIWISTASPQRSTAHHVQ